MALGVEPGRLAIRPLLLGLQIAIAGPILIVLVEFVYRFVEMPLTRYGKRLVERRSASMQITANGNPSVRKMAA